MISFPIASSHFFSESFYKSCETMAAESEQKTNLENPYANLEAVFEPYVTYIEQQL